MDMTLVILNTCNFIKQLKILRWRRLILGLRREATETMILLTERGARWHMLSSQEGALILMGGGWAYWHMLSSQAGALILMGGGHKGTCFLPRQGHLYWWGVGTLAHAAVSITLRSNKIKVSIPISPRNRSHIWKYLILSIRHPDWLVYQNNLGVKSRDSIPLIQGGGDKI